MSLSKFVSFVSSIAGNAHMAANGCGWSMSKSNLPAVAAFMDQMLKQQVVVGVPRADSARPDGNSMNNAARLYVHEYGEPAANIPARPTLGPGIMDAQKEIDKSFKSVAMAIGSQDARKIQVGLHRAGAAARDAVKARISSNTPPPLAARTLQDRRARGKMSTKTLVDSGQMRNSINYEVRTK
jgi:hypothetical protein